MSNLGNILLEKEILLESGTNEVEVIVFRVGGLTLGVNVAKVREILPAPELTQLPMAHASIIGCFNLRDTVVPCVSLHHYLKEEPSRSRDELTVILTEFNQYQTAFVVDEVERIHRLRWERVLAAPSLITQEATPVTAVTEIEGRLVSMLDFEMIADEVSDQAHRPKPVANTQALPREELKIVLADDSATVRQAVAEMLEGSGYTNLHSFENGELAWEWIEGRFAETNDVREVADLLVSDVEMPRVDGFHLTKKIKTHPELQSICVLLYSSIMTQDNHKKGASVGADAMVTKPELSKIVEKADELLRTRQDKPTEVVQADNEVQDNSQTLDRGNVPEVATAAVPESAPPSGERCDSVSSTFRAELASRAERLAVLCQLASEGTPNAQLLSDVQRVLHSVKSAAMVVPVDPVSQVTHDMEDRMAVAGRDMNRWPHAELNAYVGWLRELANPTLSAEELQLVLHDAPAFEVQLANA